MTIEGSTTARAKRRLRNLRIDRVDLVTAGANPGAHVALFKADQSERYLQEIIGALLLRAEELDLDVPRQALKDLAEQAQRSRKTFVAQEWDDRLRALAEQQDDEETESSDTEETEKAKVPDATTIKDALTARVKELKLTSTEPQLDALVKQIRAALNAKNAKPFRVEDWDDELKARADKPESYENPGVTKAQDPDLQRHREMLRERQIEALSAEYQRQGYSRMEAVVKAALEAQDLTTQGHINAIAKTMEANGLTPGMARLEAARAVLKIKSVELRGRGERPSIEPSREAVQIAEILRKARVAKKLTQEELASEVGVTVRSVAKWESGRALPSGLHVWRTANILGLGREDVQKIAMAARTTAE